MQSRKRVKMRRNISKFKLNQLRMKPKNPRMENKLKSKILKLKHKLQNHKKAKIA